MIWSLMNNMLIKIRHWEMLVLMDLWTFVGWFVTRDSSNLIQFHLDVIYDLSFALMLDFDTTRVSQNPFNCKR